MNTTEFNQLELQVDDLLQRIAQLQAENLILQQQLKQSTQGYTQLQQKHQAITHEIKNMISHLKEELA